MPPACPHLRLDGSREITSQTPTVVVANGRAYQVFAWPLFAAIVFLGAAKGDRPRPHHNQFFDIDESVLPIGAALLAETADGTLVAQERHFDPLSGFLTVESTWRGRDIHEERAHRIRLYTPSQLAGLMLQAGFVVEQAFDGFSNRALGRRTSEMMLIARKDPP